MKIVKFVDRSRSHCDKWNNFNGKYKKSGLIGLWVADMDFKCCDEILNSIKEYIDFGILGYSEPKEGYYSQFIDWELSEHGVIIKKDWIRFSPSVVSAINWLLNIYTEENDSVMINPPVYYPFSDAIKNNNRRIVCSNLKEKDMYYTLDFDDIENKIKVNNVKVYILCNPHNPIGRIWRKNEIEKIIEICKRNDVLIISDEIHQDLNFDIFKNTSILKYINEYDNIVVTTSASKTFNIAGCNNSFVIIKNKNLRNKFDDYVLKNNICSGNTIGYIAVEAAYKYGKNWLEEAKMIIYENYKYIKKELKEYKGIRVSELEGTYLLWIDFNKALKGRSIHEFMEKDCNLAVDYGEWFGGNRYEGYVRINLATSKEIIYNAVKTIKEKI